MSAEMENKEKEDTAKQAEVPKKSNRVGEVVKALKNWPIVIKVLQLLICSLCLGLAYDPIRTVGLGTTHLHHVGVMYTSFTGYMLINVVILISRALGDELPPRTSAMFSFCGAALFLATGIFLAIDRSESSHKIFHPQEHLLIMWSWSVGATFVNFVLFAVEAAMIIYKASKERQ